MLKPVSASEQGFNEVVIKPQVIGACFPGRYRFTRTFVIHSLPTYS
jgi:ribosomal protein S19